MGASSDTAICLSVCLSIPAIDAQLSWAIGTQTACSLAMCGLRTRPRTDVDPPRVELPSAGAYRLAAPGAITCSTVCFFCMYNKATRCIAGSAPGTPRTVDSTSLDPRLGDDATNIAQQGR